MICFLFIWHLTWIHTRMRTLNIWNNLTTALLDQVIYLGMRMRAYRLEELRITRWINGSPRILCEAAYVMHRRWPLSLHLLCLNRAHITFLQLFIRFCRLHVLGTIFCHLLLWMWYHPRLRHLAASLLDCHLRRTGHFQRIWIWICIGLVLCSRLLASIYGITAVFVARGQHVIILLHLQHHLKLLHALVVIVSQRCRHFDKIVVFHRFLVQFIYVLMMHCAALLHVGRSVGHIGIVRVELALCSRVTLLLGNSGQGECRRGTRRGRWHLVNLTGDLLLRRWIYCLCTSKCSLFVHASKF